MKIFKDPKIILDYIIASIAIFTALFFLSGFFYNYFFLSYFDIDVSRYFLLSDYLESSVSVIFLCVVMALWGVMPHYIGVLIAELESMKADRELDLMSDPCERCRTINERYEVAKREYEKVNKLYVIINTVAFIYFLATLIMYLWVGGWLFFVSLFLPICLIVYLLIKTYRYFGEKKIIIANTFHAIISYPIILYMLISTSIVGVLNNYSLDKSGLAFVAEKQLITPADSLYFLTSNSGYLFFLDKDKKAVIIPRESIGYYMEKNSLSNPLKWIIPAKYSVDQYKKVAKKTTNE